MSTRLKSLLLFCCLVLATFANAEAKTDQTSIDVDRSTKEYVEIQREVMKTLYRQEPYKTTCYNREYYTEKECGNQTKYRRECSTIPGRNHCYTDYERQCRTVYQEECSTSYERECRTIPGEVRCHRAPNGEQRCEKIPMREECSNVPRRQCRQVPRQQCENVPRQRCEWIPPTQQCQDIPYQEYVCNDVQKYRDVPYACTKYKDVPYEVLDQLVIGKVNFEASALANSDTRYKANFSINNSKDLSVNVTNVETSKAVILRAKKSQKNSVNGDVKTIEANYQVTEEQPALSSVLKDVKVSWVSLTREKITIAINKEIDFSKLDVGIEITKDSRTYFDREVQAQHFSVSKRNGMTYVALNVIENGGSELDGVLNKKFHVNLVLKHKYQVQNPESVIFENVSQNLKTEVKFSTIVKRD